MLTEKQIDRLNSHYCTCAICHVGASIVKELQDEHDRLQAKIDEIRAECETESAKHTDIYAMGMNTERIAYIDGRVIMAEKILAILKEGDTT